MSLFNKLNKPVFLKDTSDAEEYISKLKELSKKSHGELKKKIDLEIKFTSIGLYGEKNIAFELENSGIPMYILHDIHLEIDNLTAQIDYIVVTRKNIYVIECKNLIGNINIDSNGNFTREYVLNGKKIKEGIYSPITQNARHLEVLRQIRVDAQSNKVTRFLMDKMYNTMYHGVVVLANPKTILNDRYAKKGIKDKVIRADQLINYIEEMDKASDLAPMKDKDMEAMATRLLQHHTPNKSDYTKKFESLIGKSIDKEEREKEAVSHFDKDNLYQELKNYRLEKSREENIKAYYIFTNAQLSDLIDKKPRTNEELEEIKGFGKVKVEKYGDEIIKIINEFPNR